jgi:hypothetical protein
VSLNRPSVAQRVPGGLGSQMSWHLASEDCEVISLTHRPSIAPLMFLVHILTRGWVNPRAMVRSEGNMSLKNSVSPPGIDPGTVHLVAQHLNQYATPGPSYFRSIRLIMYKLLWITKSALGTSGRQPTWNILQQMNMFLSNFIRDFSLNSVNQIQTDIVLECLHTLYLYHPLVHGTNTRNVR